jgi:hypothetical protein
MSITLSGRPVENLSKTAQATDALPEARDAEPEWGRGGAPLVSDAAGKGGAEWNCGVMTR